jgi:hypothetical protein
MTAGKTTDRKVMQIIFQEGIVVLNVYDEGELIKRLNTVDFPVRLP